MGDLSENFSRREFACKCGCGKDTVDVELLKYLEQIRSHFDARVTVTSGNRCASHNARAGGLPTSQHLVGRAADIVISNIDPSIVSELADQLGVPGVGSYDTFTHIDTRSPSGVKARW